jgi:hypothetical protein
MSCVLPSMTSSLCCTSHKKAKHVEGRQTLFCQAEGIPTISYKAGDTFPKQENALHVSLLTNRTRRLETVWQGVRTPHRTLISI